MVKKGAGGGPTDHQFEAGSRVLRAARNKEGILLPLLNTSVMAVELYLKSLSSESKFVPQMDGGAIIYPNPDVRKHSPSILLDAIPADIRTDMEHTFAARLGHGRETLRDRCAKYDDLFMASRYPFDEKLSIDGVVMRKLQEHVVFSNTFFTQSHRTFGFRLLLRQALARRESAFGLARGVVSHRGSTHQCSCHSACALLPRLYVGERPVVGEMAPSSARRRDTHDHTAALSGIHRPLRLA